MSRDLAGKITFWTQGMERLYGWTKAQAIGKVSHKLLLTKFPKPLLEIEDELRSTGNWQGELVHVTRDGREIAVASHWILHRDAEGEPLAVLEIFNDITERLKAQRQLQEKADQLASMTQQLWQTSKLATMGELAASVAHELNNPLATVSLRAEMLLDQLTEDDPKQRSLKIIIGEVERMGMLVTNLLQFTPRSYRQVSTLDVRDEVTKSLELISYYLRNRKVQVVTEFQDSTPQIIADRQQLRQVFLNIMTNASDAMPGGGTLTVRVRGEQSPAGITVEFVDNGVGIAAPDLEKIWEPFYTSKPEGKGTGLGLPICSRIVEEHGGTIALESKFGKGTTVCIALPVAVGPTAFPNRSESSLTSLANQRRTAKNTETTAVTG